MVLKSHQCLQCDYKATKKDKLQRHKQSVHEGLRIQCPHCEYKATEKGHLRTHIKSIHEGQKFQCPQCNYKASFKSNLWKHIKSEHQNDKNCVESEEYFEAGVKSETGSDVEFDK